MTDSSPALVQISNHATVLFEKTKTGDMHLKISKGGKTIDVPLTMVPEKRNEIDLSGYVTPQELLESLIN